MSFHPSTMQLEDLRDACLIGAQCLYDPELHDGPGPEEPPEDQQAREAVAKEVCESCPVVAACLEYAERTRPERGIWAGLTVDQLRELTRFEWTSTEPQEAA